MGIVYVLVNEAMPGLVKIGKVTKEGKTVEDRMKELDTTGVPMPFECFAAWEVERVDEAESALKSTFAENKLRARHEFFRMSPDKPATILSAFGSKDVTPKGDVVKDDAQADDDLRALNRERNRRQNFSFDAVGIKTGAELQSVFDERVVCVVSDNKMVVFRDQPMSLSGAALVVAHEHGREWQTINGPLHWKWRGKTLAEWRDRLAEDNTDAVPDP